MPKETLTSTSTSTKTFSSALFFSNSNGIVIAINQYSFCRLHIQFTFSKKFRERFKVR